MLRWVSQGTKELPSTGVHMTVHTTNAEKFIYISTALDSHICYKVHALEQPQVVGSGSEIYVTFEQVFTDAREHASAHHLVYDLSLASTPQADSTMQDHVIVLLSDKTCSLTGLFHSQMLNKRFTAPTLFEACLPRSVIRVHRGNIRPPWRQPHASPGWPFPSIPGIVVDDIMGACTDGTIYNFTILTTEARRLLRLIQNLLEVKRAKNMSYQFSTARQHSGEVLAMLQQGIPDWLSKKIKARDVNPEMQERGEAAPRFKHVDGDTIRTFLDEDGDLERLVTEGCEDDVSEMFMKSFHGLLHREVGTGNSPMGHGSIFEWANRWVAQVLMPLL